MYFGALTACPSTTIKHPAGFVFAHAYVPRLLSLYFSAALFPFNPPFSSALPSTARGTGHGAPRQWWLYRHAQQLPWLP